jgi:UDP-glucuronate 4-epimerase
LFNIGNRQPIPLLRFIEVLEQELGRAAIRDLHPLQPGDVPATAADTDALAAWIGFQPSTAIETGVARFAHWYRAYYPA